VVGVPSQIEQAKCHWTRPLIAQNSAENRVRRAGAIKKANFFVWLAQRSNIRVVTNDRSLPRRSPEGEDGCSARRDGRPRQETFMFLIAVVVANMSGETEAALR
jgi:hypothetical protein